MGTWYHIKFLPTNSSVSPKEVKRLVDRRLEEINAKMSTYLPDSELSQFNHSLSTKPFKVSGETLKVVSQALLIGNLSRRALDVTVLPLVELWGFGAKPRREEPPSEAKVLAAKQKTGLGKLKVDQAQSTLEKSDPQLSIDLSSIAKGYAVDQVSNLLTELHLTNHLVEIGGELRASGEKAPGRSWRVGIEVPDGTVGQVQRSLNLNNLSMATSGDYRNYFEKKGIRYSHTINPQTGHPIQHHLASISVVAKDCMTADGWATALNVLGEVKGFTLAEKRGLKAYFIYRSDKGFQTKSTTGFQSLSQPSQTDKN